MPLAVEVKNFLERHAVAIRFGVAAAVTLGTDAMLVYALVTYAGLALTPAVAISFAVNALALYFIHEYWTFRSPASTASPTRLAKNLGAAIAALTVRVAVVGALEWFFPPQGYEAALYFALGVSASFTTNFLINRHVVFRR